MGSRHVHIPLNHLDLGKVRGTFLVRTRGSAWYLVRAKASPSGLAEISGGSSKLRPKERHISDGTITTDHHMLITGRKSFHSNEVIAIYNVTGLSRWKIWRLKNAARS